MASNRIAKLLTLALFHWIYLTVGNFCLHTNREETSREVQFKQQTELQIICSHKLQYLNMSSRLSCATHCANTRCYVYGFKPGRNEVGIQCSFCSRILRLKSLPYNLNPSNNSSIYRINQDTYCYYKQSSTLIKPREETYHFIAKQLAVGHIITMLGKRLQENDPFKIFLTSHKNTLNGFSLELHPDSKRKFVSVVLKYKHKKKHLNGLNIEMFYQTGKAFKIVIFMAPTGYSVYIDNVHCGNVDGGIMTPGKNRFLYYTTGLQLTSVSF